MFIGPYHFTMMYYQTHLQLTNNPRVIATQAPEGMKPWVDAWLIQPGEKSIQINVK